MCLAVDVASLAHYGLDCSLNRQVISGVLSDAVKAWTAFEVLTGIKASIAAKSLTDNQRSK